MLIILTDDQPDHEDFLSVMPETKRLFRDGGTEYTNGVVTTPLCCPSRTSIFSGQYVHNHGVKGHFAAFKNAAPRTVQHELRAQGYFTAISGKFLNGWTANRPDFDRWATALHNGDYTDIKFNINGTTAVQPGYTTDIISNHAVSFLDEFESLDDAKPWFMQISPNAPHGPATPEPKFAKALVPAWQVNPATLEEDVSDKPAYVRNAAVLKSGVVSFRRNQLRTLMSVDVLVARVFQRLEELGEADNTIAFFTSDNGHMLYEHRIKGKKYPYNEAIEVPLFVRWPGRVLPGFTNPALSANIDIAPTIYQALGMTPSYTVDGKPLGSSVRNAILIEYLAGDPAVPVYRAMWSPDQEYIRYYTSTSWPSVEPQEYYSEGDPWQLQNLYGDGIEGNEPINQAELDAFITSQQNCVGAECQ